jgi:glucans biosynthesis protein
MDAMDQRPKTTRIQNLQSAPRCGAKTRGGTPCQRPALRGRKRCRLHGGLSPGAPRGVKNGNYKNGDWTAEAIAERKWLRTLVQAFGRTKSTDE